MASGPFSPLLRFLRKIAAPPSAAELGDGQLLERFAADRDESAFASLVRRHGSMVLGVCQSILFDLHDAEDAFQATFLVLVRKAGSIGKPDSVGPWLHGVAYRLSMRVRADLARRRKHEPRAPVMANTEPDSEMIWRDLRPVLHEEVERLPHRYRAPFVLCYLEGKTNEEAAELLGWPKGTVLSSLARARDRLRERLTRRGVALSAAALATLLAQQPAPAAVPSALAVVTVKSAVLYATGSAAAGTISASVLADTNAMLKGMLVARTRVAAILLLGLGALGTGTVFVAHRFGNVDPAPVVKAEGPPAPTRPDVPAVPQRPDRELLMGTWIVVAGEQQGKPIDEFVKGDRLTVSGSDFTMNAVKGEPLRLFRRGLTTGLIALDTASSPRRIDFTDQARTLQGIYLLEGDTLKICLGDPDTRQRPDRFTSRPDDRQMVLVFKRQ